MKIIWNIIKAIFKVTRVSDVDNVRTISSTKHAGFFFIELLNLTKLMGYFAVTKKKEKERKKNQRVFKKSYRESMKFLK